MLKALTSFSHGSKKDGQVPSVCIKQEYIIMIMIQTKLINMHHILWFRPIAFSSFLHDDLMKKRALENADIQDHNFDAAASVLALVEGVVECCHSICCYRLQSPALAVKTVPVLVRIHCHLAAHSWEIVF